MLTGFAFYVNNNWVPKAALEAFKARGGTLGNPRHAEALPKANAARSARAKEFNARIRGTIEEINDATAQGWAGKE